MNLFKKIFAGFFIFVLVFPTNLVLAADYPMPTEAMDQIMTDLGMEKGEVRKSVADNNVSRFKKNPSGVTLTFVPASPTHGKKLTALAVPANFTGNPELMYHTWYLKRKDCKKAEEGDNGYVEACDLNKDDEVDVEDWKIEAMRLLAKGDWKPDYESKGITERITVDENQNGTLEDEYYDEYYDSIQGSDPDKDGYDSVFGGEDQRGKPEHCYVKDIPSGVDYEIMGSACPKAIHADEETDLSEPGFACTNPDICDVPVLAGLDPLTVSSGNRAEATIEFTPTASAGGLSEMNLPTVPDGINPCTVLPEAEWARSWLGYVFNGQWQVVRQDILNFDSGRWKRDIYIDDGSSRIPEDWLWNHCNEEKGVNVYTPPIGENLYFAMSDLTCQNPDPTERSAFGSFTWDFYVAPSGDGIESECKHVFPRKYHMDGEDVETIQEDDEYLLVGDPDKESFTNMEEKFWGTDPESKDTNNDGVPDEKALTGLGMKSLSWIYEEGDQIGVALEGVAENTNYKDSSLKIMWGLPNNDFDGDDNCKVNPDTITVGSGSEEIERDITVGTEINDCLEENFIDPAQGNSDKKIEVSLSYMPQYPINDPEGKSSDELAIQADLLNIEDKSFVKYDWTLWACLTMTDEHCTLLTRSLLDQYQTGLFNLTGLGLDSLKIKLSFPVGTSFLKIKLRAIESTEQSSGKEGEGAIFIPLQESVLSIKSYQTIVDDSGSFPTISLGTTEDDCQNKECLAVKNEIIGLRIDDASDYELAWFLDGKPLLTREGSENETFFPILKDAGSKYSVRLDLSNEAEKITLVRNFNVEDPKVTLDSYCAADDPGCTLPEKVEIGYAVDPKYPDVVTRRDYNENLLLAETDSVITLKPTFNFDPSIFEKRDAAGNLSWRFNWFVDGDMVDQTSTSHAAAWVDPATGNLHLPIDREEGYKYKVSIEALYTQSGPVKKALTGLWNVEKEYFYDKPISDSIEIGVDDPATTTQAGPGKILASLFSLVPNYLNFLFRAILTSMLVLFLANLSLVFFPKRSASR